MAPFSPTGGPAARGRAALDRRRGSLAGAAPGGRSGAAPPGRAAPRRSERATQVEVTFDDAGASGTRVTLEHRGFDSYGESGGPMRDAVAGDEGWPVLMERYAQVAAG